MIGSNAKIFEERLHFRENAMSKINSFEKFYYQPKASDIQIFNERLPWLKYNKPNLPEHVKYQIEKKEYPVQTEVRLNKIKPNETESKSPHRITGNASPNFINPQKNPLVKNKIETNKRKNDDFDSEKIVSSSKNNYLENHAIKPYPVSNNKDRMKMNNTPIKKLTSDACTETDKIFQISVEVQASLNENLRNKTSKKLKKSLINSSTVPDKSVKDPTENSYSKSYGTKSNLKKRLDTKSNRSDEIITNEKIDMMLPSLPQPLRENVGKHYSSYTYPNSFNQSERHGENHNFNKFAVTHVGIGFLDQYWAAQRRQMLNKENIQIPDKTANHSAQYSSEKVSHFPHSNSTFESSYSLELNNKRMISQFSKRNTNKSNEKVDKITDRDLEKFMV